MADKEIAIKVSMWHLPVEMASYTEFLINYHSQGSNQNMETLAS